MKWRRRSRSARPSGGGRDWVRCPRCVEILPADEVSRQQGVCPACGYHHPLGWDERVEGLCDAGSFEEQDQRLATEDLLRFKGAKRYKDQLAEARKASGSDEAVRAGIARLDGRQVALAVVDPEFLQGAVGAVAGERLARTLARAAANRCPAVLVLAGGAPRHAEGLIGQVQIARLADQRATLYDASVPLVAVLVPPLPDPPLLHLATSADVVLAEPADAGVGEGPSAEDLREAGLVDRIVPRAELKAELSRLLSLLQPD